MFLVLASVIATWTPPTSLINGDPLPVDQIQQYNFYYTPNDGALYQLPEQAKGDQTRQQLNISGAGCVQMTTVANGAESDLSEKACFDFGWRPSKATIQVEIKFTLP